MNESVKCVRDVRDTTPRDYRLPTDGRTWRHQCDRRCALAQWLATFADGDGSNITVGIKRMAERLGVSRWTVTRLLDDLRTLGFLEDGQLTGFKGTRRRSLNVPAMLAKSPDVATTQNPDVAGTQDRCSNYAAPDVASTQSDVASTHGEDEFCRVLATQPTFCRPSTTTDLRTELQKPQNENQAEVVEVALISAANAAGSQTCSDADCEENHCIVCRKHIGKDGEICDSEDCEETMAQGDYEFERNHRWRELQTSLPRDLAASAITDDQIESVKQMLMSLGLILTMRIISVWLMDREQPVDGIKTNRWSFFLREYPAHERKAKSWTAQTAKEWASVRAYLV